MQLSVSLIIIVIASSSKCVVSNGGQPPTQAVLAQVPNIGPRQLTCDLLTCQASKKNQALRKRLKNAYESG